MGITNKTKNKSNKKVIKPSFSKGDITFKTMQNRIRLHLT